MTATDPLQAAAVPTAIGPATEAKTIKGSPKWGDLLLRVVAGLVLLYLFLPILVIVLFSFNDPQGKFNYTWQGFTFKNWADPFKYPALTDAMKLSINVAAVSTAVALVLGSLVAIALVRQRWRGQQGGGHVPHSAAHRARGGDGRRAAGALPRPRLGRGIHDDRVGTHRV